MADSNDPTLQQEIFAATRRILVENYCIVASSMLLFYDCAITFPRELKRVWLRRTTGATIVFILTRYTAVAERITLLTSLFLSTLHDSSCVPVLRLDDSLTDLSYASIGAFTALRLFGIYNEWWPAALIIGIWVARISIAIFLQVRYEPIAFGPPLWGCGAHFLPDASTVQIDTTTNSLVLASDALLLVLTWVKTLGIRRTSTRLGMRAPLSTLLLRDGTMYFAAILFIQIFAIVSSEVGAGFILFDVWTYFAQVFNVIFLCRFMLNLRGIYLAESPEDTLGESSYLISDVHFATIIGNMAAPLNTPVLFSQRQNDSDDSDSVEISNNPFLVGLSATTSSTAAGEIELQNADAMTKRQDEPAAGASSS